MPAVTERKRVSAEDIVAHVGGQRGSAAVAEGGDWQQ